MSKAPKKVRVNPELADKENPNWTKRDFARAKRLEDFPELAHLSKRRGERGPQKAPVKKPVTIRLDQDVVAHFRAKGTGWQSQMNDALRAAAKLTKTKSVSAKPSR